MKLFRFFAYLLMCAAPISAHINPARADCVVSQMPTAKVKIVRDDNNLRTIEVVTERDETVEQFFARQKLVLIDKASSNNKSWSVDQIVKGEAFRIFVSYPLQNDQGFRPYLYGAFYKLEKPAPAVAALFADDLAFNWKNTMLIVKTLPPANPVSLELTLSDMKRPNARIVGFVSIKDQRNWRPEMEAESLKFQQPEATTK